MKTFKRIGIHIQDAQNKFIILLRCSCLTALLSFVTTSVAATELTSNPMTHNVSIKSYQVIILVDVLVDIDGSAKEVKLSDPKRRTSFNGFAELKAKNDKYPIKKENGQPITYWQKNIEVTISPSPKN